MKWQMPFKGGGSWREPRRTQTPTVTERSCGIRSLKTVRPLGKRVVRTSSVIPFGEVSGDSSAGRPV
jgi:hypothetical protein